MFIPFFIVLVLVAGVILVAMNIRLVKIQQERARREAESQIDYAPGLGAAFSEPETSPEHGVKDPMEAGVIPAAQGAESEEPMEGDRAYREALRQEARAGKPSVGHPPDSQAEPDQPGYRDDEYRSALRAMDKNR